MKLEKFKELIKEAVREVLMEENFQKTQINENFQKTPSFLRDIHKTNGIEKITNRPLSTGNPLLDLLNETKSSMGGDDWDDIGQFNSSNSQGFNPNTNNSTPVVETMNDVFANTRGGSTEEQIQVGAVPDFSKLMGSMKDKGLI